MRLPESNCALDLQRLRPSGGGFHRRDVLLRDFVHLRDSQIDLCNAVTVLCGGSGNFARDAVTRATARVTSAMVHIICSVPLSSTLWCAIAWTHHPASR